MAGSSSSIRFILNNAVASSALYTMAPPTTQFPHIFLTKSILDSTMINLENATNSNYAKSSNKMI